MHLRLKALPTFPMLTALHSYLKDIVMRVCSPLLSILASAFIPSAALATDTVYFDGSILTMAGNSPSYAEALVTKDGNISFVGTYDDAKALASDSTEMLDLEDSALLPGLIDSHSHVTQMGLALSVANLAAPPPMGRPTISRVCSRHYASTSTTPRSPREVGFWSSAMTFRTCQTIPIVQFLTRCRQNTQS